MSIKMQLRYQTRYFFQFVHSLMMPTWLDSWKAKMGVTALVMVLGVAYIMQTNTLATSGYVINNLQNKIDDKNSEIQKLETKVASFQSMNSIQGRLANVKLVPADKISFININKNSQVAER